MARSEGQQVTLSNDRVSLRFDLAKRAYSVADVQGELLLENAWLSADGWDAGKFTCADEAVTDELGHGRRMVLAMDPGRPAAPVYLFTFTLYEGQPAVVMGFGLRNTCDYGVRFTTVSPMTHAAVKDAAGWTDIQTLNGSAGAEPARVQPGRTRDSANSLLLTGVVAGKRRSVVWGGLRYHEFGKWAGVKDLAIEIKAQDPVGRLVDPGQTYFSPDTFYLDVTTPDPFQALEQYGRALRAANHARPNVYDFPVLCGWGVGALSHLPGVNNSKALVGELEAARKCGFTAYTKVAIRLEPDTYCYRDGNTEQGWWDDEHWARYGHLVPPYDTFAKWCAALQERDGVPYTYFQMGMPSDDYARAYPDHMLFKDISRLAVKHPHHQPLVSYDYTAAGFQKHVLATWQRLRKEGMRGIKFDYPETAWRPEGGFENRYATTAFVYREAFRLAREGLGPEALLDERNLGESGRPCLDVTAGLVDTQRNWSDSNAFTPEMITIGGLRWYKNRTVFNYYPDSKKVHDCTPEIRRAMLTMVYLTSGRIDLATSFTLFTPEIVHDFSRLYPAYREPFTARPADAFTGVKDPRVYDLALTPDWHQVALLNTGSGPATVSAPLGGDPVASGALGLDPAASYYVYDFWADTLVGKVPGSGKVERSLGSHHCAMLSVRRVQEQPQVLSTNRHLLQGWVELSAINWDAATKRLSGIAQVVGGEAMRIVLAGNGRKLASAGADGATAALEAHAAGPAYAVLVLKRPESGPVTWHVDCE